MKILPTSVYLIDDQDARSQQPLLILSDWFVPGYKAGGPIRSVFNVVRTLSSSIPVRVITRDRDLGDTVPYSGIINNQWQTLESMDATVRYCSPKGLTLWRMIRELRSMRPRSIYLNSMFSWYFTVLPLLFCRVGLVQAQVILAPRGMLKPSALQFKSMKKRLFLAVFRMLGIHHRITFQATSVQEEADIRCVFGRNCRTVLLPNLMLLPPEQMQSREKHEQTQFIFIGRIHPIKNLHLALEAFFACPYAATLRIVGGLEDLEYWRLCQEFIQRCPDHLRVYYVGEWPHSVLQEGLAAVDFLLLPTQGENFGYAIAECLAAGIPVIISDQTPWQELQAHQTGWSLPLAEPQLFKAAVAAAASMPRDTYTIWSRSAQRYARSAMNQEALIAAYRDCFNVLE